MGKELCFVLLFVMPIWIATCLNLAILFIRRYRWAVFREKNHEEVESMKVQGVIYTKITLKNGFPNIIFLNFAILLIGFSRFNIQIYQYFLKIFVEIRSGCSNLH